MESEFRTRDKTKLFIFIYLLTSEVKSCENFAIFFFFTTITINGPNEKMKIKELNIKLHCYDSKIQIIPCVQSAMKRKRRKTQTKN